MTEVVIRRSAWRMWITSLVVIPLIVMAVDVLTQRRITNALRDMVFRPDDTQLFEFRDVVWAWVILIVAGGVAIWALRELIVPVKMVEADGSGVRLQVTAPFQKSLFLAWSDIEDIGSATVEDDGVVFPVLWIRVAEQYVGLPDPWSARWMDDRTLALMASDWDIDAIEASRRLTELAISVAEPEPDVESESDPPSGAGPETSRAPEVPSPSELRDRQGDS